MRSPHVICEPKVWAFIFSKVVAVYSVCFQRSVQLASSNSGVSSYDDYPANLHYVFLKPFSAFVVGLLGSCILGYGWIRLRCMESMRDFYFGLFVTAIGFALVMIGSGLFLMWQRDRIMNESLDSLKFVYDLTCKFFGGVIHPRFVSSSLVAL